MSNNNNSWFRNLFRRRPTAQEELNAAAEERRQQAQAAQNEATQRLAEARAAQQREMAANRAAHQQDMEAVIRPPAPPVGLPAENRRALFPPRRARPTREETRNALQLAQQEANELAAIAQQQRQQREANRRARPTREETRNALQLAQQETDELAAIAQQQREANIGARPTPTVTAPGVAFEIHDAFDNFKMAKFMDIIRREITNNPPPENMSIYFQSRIRPLTALFEYIENREQINQLMTIQSTIISYPGYDTNRQNVIDVIKFVVTQPEEFITAYIQTLITDCMRAYSTGRTQSCVKGMY